MNSTFIQLQKISIVKPDNTEYDLDINEITSISLSNDLEQIGITSQLIYRDITDLKTLMPIKGGETVKITLTQEDGNSVSKDLTISKCDSIGEDNQASMLKFSLVSKSSFKLLYDRDYKYYEDSPTNIIKNYISKLEGESSSILNVLIPGYSHTKAIQYITDMSGGYVYETNTGYSYKTLEDMMIVSDDVLVFKSNNMYNKNLILDFNELGTFNVLGESSKNIYKNINKSYNPDTKQIDEVKHTIEDTQKNNKTFGSGANYSDEINKDIGFRVLVTTPNKLNSNNYDKLFNKSYEILIRGDLKYEVGNTVNVEFTERLNGDPSRSLSGLWLIKKTAHYINNKEFVTKLTIIKNAYNIGDETTNVV